MGKCVNIYVYDIASCEFDAEKIPLLEPARKECILTAKNHLYRLRSLYAGLLLRRAMKEEGCVTEGPLDVKYNEHGKPYIEGAKRFNIAHSVNIVMVAVADFEIGLDTEIKQNKIYSELAPRVMAEAEYAEYQAKTGGEKSLFFITKWVMKESYLKFKGTGLLGYPSDVITGDGCVMGVPCVIGDFVYRKFLYIYAVCAEAPFEVNLKFVKSLKTL